MKVLVFDTETTGFGPKGNVMDPSKLDEWPYIVQFSFVGYDTELNIITDRYNKVIRLPPGISIPPESSEIHRITTEMSMNSTTTLEDVF